MDKIKVRYDGGQSREGSHAVDYMLAEVDGVELYAELPPIEGNETGTYEALKAEIIAQAQERGIDVARFAFEYEE